MISQPKSLQYFNQTDKILFIDHKKAPSQQNQQQPLTESTKREKFFCELEIDEQYCFDNNSNEISKKSLKLMKMIQKQTSEEMRCQRQRQKSSLCFGDNGGLPHFSQDISSISYVCEQNTPLDSVWSRLVRQQEESQRNYEEQLENGQQDGFEDGQQCEEQQQEDSQSQSNHHSNQQPLNQASHLPNLQLNHPSPPTLSPPSSPPPQPQSPTTISQSPLSPKLPTYKPTSLQFKTVNNYIKNYLKQKPSGIIIHPQYSTIIEEHSQLAVEGKLLRMKVNSNMMRRKDKCQQVNVISINGYDDFLKEVFDDEGEGNQREIGDYSEQKQSIENNIAQR